MDPAMTAFGLRFLLSGPQTEKETLKTTQITDRLATLSIAHIEALVKDRKLDVPMHKGGVLMYFREEAKLRALVDETKNSYPVEQHAERFRIVSAEECVALEPMLARQREQLVGGLHWLPDQTVCSLTFCKALARSLAAEGISFLHGEGVAALKQAAGGAASISLSSGKQVEADALVLAAGVGTGMLLRRLALAGAPPLPLYGMRGHSCTVDASHMLPTSGLGNHDHVLQRSICDADSMVFFSPLRGEGTLRGRRLLRIAAFGDFDGWGHGPVAVRPWRMKQLLSVSERNFGPELLRSGAAALAALPPVPRSSLGDELCPAVDDATRWTGLRPMSPDGLPMVGAAGTVGRAPVFVNTGHGALGWTLSGGTGEVLGELMSEQFAGRISQAKPGTPSEQETLRGLSRDLEPSRFRWSEVFRRARKIYFEAS